MPFHCPGAACAPRPSSPIAAVRSWMRRRWCRLASSRRCDTTTSPTGSAASSPGSSTCSRRTCGVSASTPDLATTTTTTATSACRSRRSGSRACRSTSSVPMASVPGPATAMSATPVCNGRDRRHPALNSRIQAVIGRPIRPRTCTTFRSM